ncbi:MAG: hydantoinase/oxoprolinase family protein [Immundisolibacterales bacterium]|nr:hydantoinase/oxoprolinase family protein [Immundisolibacterales bacterium]
MRVGIEVGGTFTDLVAVDGESVRTAKVPSTPANPDEGAMHAIDAAGLDPGAIEELVHGSTVATNAVLERKGAVVCLFVTKGIRDVLLLQRHDKDAIYDLRYAKPEPVVRRRDVIEVDERIAADGTVIKRPDRAAVAGLVRGVLADGDYEAAALCFLHAYANPDHERLVAGVIRELAPSLPVTCSHDVTREFREYERASTTALAAYVQPVMAGYVSRFSAALAARGFAGRFSIMQSNGGRMPAEAMARNAISALFSGPAAGVVGAVRSVAGAGYRNLITLDMGGTSTDVALIADGRPELASMTRIDGLPVKTPVIDIVTVGAGGGSIAWTDDGGLLRTGPGSAGAVPGPACYRRGGERPTVTDAHLVRGTLRADGFLGGRMEVDRDAARRVYRPLARQLGLSLEEIADSVIRLAEVSIVRAIQQVSTERGLDPRDYVLVSFGGAGPLHAARVAEDLAIATVVVPPHAGVLSASGLLLSDHVHYRTRTRRLAVSEANMPDIRETVETLQAQARDYLAGLGIETGADFDRVLEMRYLGQAFEVPVSLAGPDLGTMPAAELVARFGEAHRRIFEFEKPHGDPVEVVSFRVGVKAPPPPMPALRRPPSAGATELRSTALTERGEALDAGLSTRANLGRVPAGGPLLVDDGSATVYVPPGWTAACDEHDNVILHRETGP